MLVTTERLRLDPLRPDHADDLVLLHSGPDVAFWYGDKWTMTEARDWAAQMQHRWQHEGAVALTAMSSAPLSATLKSTMPLLPARDALRLRHVLEAAAKPVSHARQRNRTT